MDGHQRKERCYCWEQLPFPKERILCCWRACGSFRQVLEGLSGRFASPPAAFGGSRGDGVVQGYADNLTRQ